MKEIRKLKYYKSVNKDDIPEDKMLLVLKWGFKIKKTGLCRGNIMAKGFYIYSRSIIHGKLG